MMSLEELRKQYPEYAEMSDAGIVGSIAKQNGVSPEYVAGYLGTKWRPNAGLMGDLGTDLKRGVEQIPGAITGLADIPAALAGGGRPVSAAADKLGALTGFRPSQWAKDAQLEYSPERQQVRQELDQTWDKGGAMDVAGAYLRHPAQAIGGLVAESLPSTLAGGGIGRGAMLAGRAITGRVLPSVAAGIGEGAITAGQNFDQTDPSADPRRAAAAALAAGTITGAIGGASGVAARRLGVTDIDTWMAGQRSALARGEAVDLTKNMPFMKRVPVGMGTEAIEEALQSPQEQAWQNWAEGKPLGEGVMRAGVEGALAGGVMGGAVNIMPAGAQRGLMPPQGQPGQYPALPGAPGYQQIETNPELVAWSKWRAEQDAIAAQQADTTRRMDLLQRNMGAPRQGMTQADAQALAAREQARLSPQGDMFNAYPPAAQTTAQPQPPQIHETPLGQQAMFDQTGRPTYAAEQGAPTQQTDVVTQVAQEFGLKPTEKRARVMAALGEMYYGGHIDTDTTVGVVEQLRAGRYAAAEREITSIQEKLNGTNQNGNNVSNQGQQPGGQNPQAAELRSAGQSEPSGQAVHVQPVGPDGKKSEIKTHQDAVAALQGAPKNVRAMAHELLAIDEHGQPTGVEPVGLNDELAKKYGFSSKNPRASAEYQLKRFGLNGAVRKTLNARTGAGMETVAAEQVAGQSSEGGTEEAMNKVGVGTIETAGGSQSDIGTGKKGKDSWKNVLRNPRAQKDAGGNLYSDDDLSAAVEQAIKELGTKEAKSQMGKLIEEVKRRQTIASTTAAREASERQGLGDESTNEDLESDEEETQYSDIGEKPAKPSSKDRINATLNRLFLSKGLISRLVTVYDTQSEAKASGKMSEDYQGRAKGFTTNGHVYLIGEHIAEGQELGVILHEIGVHLGMKALVGEANLKKLADQVEVWARGGKSLESRIAQRALERANQSQSTGKDARTEELVAYFVEEAVDAGVNPTGVSVVRHGAPIAVWFSTFWDAVKAALRKLGVKNPTNLTARDIVDLATGAAMKAVETSGAQKVKPAPTGAKQFALKRTGDVLSNSEFAVKGLTRIGNAGDTKVESGYIFTHEGDAIGVVTIGYRDDAPNALYDIMITDKEQRQGWGEKVTRALAASAVDGILITNTIPTAVGFYEKLGANWIDEIKEHGDAILYFDDYAKARPSQVAADKNPEGQRTSDEESPKELGQALFTEDADTLEKVVENWKKVISDYMSGALDQRATVQMFPSTPASLQALGLPNYEIRAARHALDALDSDKTNHPLTQSQMGKLPAEMTNPALMTVRRGEDGRWSINIVTSLQNTTGPIVVALQPSKGGVAAGGPVHFVATVFSRHQNGIDAMIREGGLVYIGDTSKLPDRTKAAVQDAQKKFGQSAIDLSALVASGFSKIARTARIKHRSDLVKMVQSGEAMYSEDTLGEVRGIEQALPAKAKDAWTNIKDWAMKVGPAMMTSFQIAEQFGSKLKQLTDYVKLQQNMDAMRRELASQAHHVVTQWEALTTSVKEQLNGVMLDATLATIHPDIPFAHADNSHLTKTDQAKYEALRTRYEALPKEAKAVYQAAKAQLTKNWDARRAAYAGAVGYTYDSRIAKAKSENTKESLARAERLTQERDEAIKDHEKKVKELRGPYFPLMRFGEHLAIAESQELQDLKAQEKEAEGDEKKKLNTKIAAMEKDAKHYQVSAHETRAAAERTLEPLKKTMNTRYKLADAFRPELRPITQRALTEFGNTIDEAFDSETGGKIRDLMTQIYVRALPEHAALTREQQRKGIQGANADMLRAFAAVTQRDSFYLSRLKFSPEITDTLFKMKQAADEADLKRVYNEMEARAALDLAFQRTPVQNALTTLSWAYYLGVSPSFLFINSTQPWLITAPMLAGKFGLTRTLGALRTASVDAFSLLKNARIADGKVEWWTDIKLDAKDSNGRFLLTQPEQAMIKDLLNRGVVDIGLEHDLAMFANDEHRKLAKAQRVMGWATQQVEVINRLSSALASYRLARSQGMNADEATEYAYGTTSKTQLDYNEGNAARVMRQGGPVPFAKLIFQFRKYQQGMLYLIGSNLKTAIKGDTDAMKALGYLFVSQGLVAGALGLPFMGTILALASGLMGGDDEDGDAETRLRNWLVDVTGSQKAGQVLAKGLPMLFGVDISKRIGMADIASPFPMARFDGKTGKDVAGQVALAVAGPTGGLAAQWVDAYKQFAGGAFNKGVEKMLPKAAADLLKTYRFSTEGMTDSKGRMILRDDQFNGWDLAMRAAGFSPAIESEYYSANESKMEVEQAIKAKRESLVNQWVKAKRDGDTASVDESIQQYNEDHPRAGEFGRITSSTKLRAMQTDRKSEAERGSSGVRYRKPERGLEGLTRYAQ